MDEIDNKFLAELSDIFTEAAMGFLNENPAYDREVENSLSPEEIAVQRRLSEARTFEWGTPPDSIDEDQLARDILALNENAARFLLRAMPEEELTALIPEEHRTEDVGDGFAAHNCPVLGSLFKPS